VAPGFLRLAALRHPQEIYTAVRQACQPVCRSAAMPIFGALAHARANLDDASAG